MSYKKMLHKILPPCSKCPYKLGIIKMVDNPCPQCKLNGYESFERFQKQLKINNE